MNKNNLFIKHLPKQASKNTDYFTINLHYFKINLSLGVKEYSLFFLI
jgi:hypothetical protein